MACINTYSGTRKMSKSGLYGFESKGEIMLVEDISRRSCRSSEGFLPFIP